MDLLTLTVDKREQFREIIGQRSSFSIVQLYSCQFTSLQLFLMAWIPTRSHFLLHSLYFYYIYMIWPHRYAKYWQWDEENMNQKNVILLFFSFSRSSTRSKRRPILGLCVCFLSGAFLLSSNQLPSMPKPVSGVAKIISVIHVRKRTSSHPSSFPSLKIDIPQKKRANWRKRWLFLIGLVIFLAILFPTDNICVNSRPVLL